MQQPGNPSLDVKKAMAMAQSEQAQQLLKLLQQKDPQSLRSAMDQAAAGNYAQAAAALSSVLNDPKAKALLQQLGEKNG